MNFFAELRALDVPESIIRKIAVHFSGCPIYIPKTRISIEQRNIDICRKYDGKNARQIAIEFDLSYVQVQRIIKTARDKSQIDLFA